MEEQSPSGVWITACTGDRSTGLPPITRELYWQVGIEQLLIGGQAIIMDTGTSLLTMPQQYLSALLHCHRAQEDQYGQFLVNCNNIQNLPTFTFIIRGAQFPLPPSSYILNMG